MDFISVIAGVIVSLGTFLSGIVLGRRKSKAEARSKELSNVEQEITIYKRMMDDQQLHLEELRKMNADLLQTVQSLRERVTILEQTVSRQEKQLKTRAKK